MPQQGMGGTSPLPGLSPAPLAIPKRSARMLPSRSQSVPLTSPYTTARSSQLGSEIEQMIASQAGGGVRKEAPLLTGRSTSRLPTHRSAPLTATQQRAQAKLHQNRATFKSPPHGLPALDMPHSKRTTKILGPDDLPQPRLASHGLDGRATMPLKGIGAGGGGTKSQREAWGADRTLNQSIAQPLGQ